MKAYKIIMTVTLLSLFFLTACGQSTQKSNKITPDVLAAMDDPVMHDDLMSDDVKPLAVPADKPVGIRQGNLAPDFTVTTITGETVNIRSFAEQGKPAIVYFMATWCPYCAKDFSALEPIYAEFQNEVPIVVMSLDLKENAEKLTNYFKKYPGLDGLKVSPGQRSILIDYAVRYTTTKYAIGRDGTIIYAGSGQFSEDQWRTLFEGLKASN